MKTAFLFRHAKSDWSDGISRDFDRPLNGRGRKGAHLMGVWAKDNGLHFDSIVASPALRVTETLDHFFEGWGQSADIHWDRRIYLASSVTLLDVLREQPDTAGTVLMVGHNPGLEDIVFDTVPDDAANPLRGLIEEKYPTAAIAQLEFDVDSWKAIGKPARLTRFVRPRDLDPALGPEAEFGH